MCGVSVRGCVHPLDRDYAAPEFIRARVAWCERAASSPRQAREPTHSDPRRKHEKKSCVATWSSPAHYIGKTWTRNLIVGGNDFRSARVIGRVARQTRVCFPTRLTFHYLACGSRSGATPSRPAWRSHRTTQNCKNLRKRSTIRTQRSDTAARPASNQPRRKCPVRTFANLGPKARQRFRVYTLLSSV